MVPLIITLITGLLIKVHSANLQTIQGRNWMSFLPNTIPINDINIPGSHDSAMYFADADKYTRTQVADIEYQLTLGIRYFDIRTRYEPSKGKKLEG